MKLLIATPLYPPEPGGPATYVKILEDAFPEKGIEVVLAVFSRVRRYPKIVRHIAYFFMVLRSARGCDAVFALDPVSTGVPAALAARILRKPFYVKIVGDYAWEQGTQRFRVHDSLDAFVAHTNYPLFVQLLKRIQRRVALSAKKILVPSEYLKRIVAAWDVPASRIEVIPNAVAKLELGTIPDTLSHVPHPRIVSIGRLVPWKGMSGLIDAVEKVRETIPVSLIIVGSGPEYASLVRTAHRKLKDSCVFTGPLSHADTLAVLKDADVFALNTSYEGLSHLLLEALALGKPIVTTMVGGNPEVITHGENGMLVRFGECKELSETLRAVLLDAPLRERLSQAALERASAFSVEALVARTAAVFHA